MTLNPNPIAWCIVHAVLLATMLNIRDCIDLEDIGADRSL